VHQGRRLGGIACAPRAGGETAEVRGRCPGETEKKAETRVFGGKDKYAQNDASPGGGGGDRAATGQEERGLAGAVRESNQDRTWSAHGEGPGQKGREGFT